MFNKNTLFTLWSSRKKEINAKDRTFFVKKREIWYIHLGENIGFESSGKGNDFKRPVLILNRIGNMFLVVTMTTKGKKDGKFQHKLKENTFEKDSYISLSHIKTIDKKRFIEKIGKIGEDDFTQIKNKIREYL